MNKSAPALIEVRTVHENGAHESVTVPHAQAAVAYRAALAKVWRDKSYALVQMVAA